jgi:hypothetical protein
MWCDHCFEEIDYCRCPRRRWARGGGRSQVALRS